jgi:prepilin-type N-terminal cleavage/methylation domain-containing protein
MKHVRQPSAGRPVRGMTLIEIMIAAAISSVVAFGLIGLIIMSQRILKSNFSQQLSIRNAKRSIDGMNGINAELRMATTDVRVFNNAGNQAQQGNRVTFNRPGEPQGRRQLRLNPGPDGDFFTPWDNFLEFDPDTSKNGDEVIVSRNLSPSNSAGAFLYGGAGTPVVVQMRAGDPRPRPGDTKTLSEEEILRANAHSGRGLQGVEINITVAPRNPAT